ncbi:leucine-rich repeat-containing protein 24 [Trachinotus anak]|uniref:leucine-rich repeat-containing protein 24 n=1 Tax=Trachinotus anak TaxID=443729 RepID=UPI0039F247C6
MSKLRRFLCISTVVAALALLLVNVHFSHSCDGVDQVLICRKIPSYFSPGYLTLVMYLSDVGEINSTVFRSSNLTSVTGLRIDNAGVTAIAEGAFGSFQNLTSVSLRRNALMQINSNWFGRPAVLRELILEENQIEAVNESTLSGFINLTKLSLNKNRIRTIEPNSFRSHTNLAELDLSGNRMTRVSPQVFGALRSARIRLDGNPWDCSCEAEDLVVFLKDLQSRSLLDRPAEVTCESPPSLRGRPVWGASVCVTSPAPGPPSVSQTVPPRPTDAVTTVPVSSGTSGSSQLFFRAVLEISQTLTAE